MREDKSPIDWEAIWKSLDWDDEEHRQTLDRERLRARARQYATPIEKADERGEAGFTVLAFDLGSELYGIDVMLVRGVRPLPKIARVPGIPPFYRGVVNLRGQIVTVMDLRLFFDLPVEDDKNPPGELVIVRSNHLEIGLLTHNVWGVVHVSHAEIEPGSDARYMLGVTTTRMVILNMARVFEDERLIVGEKDS